ncbi:MULTISPECIES: secondary thiamine-phosphate synthase enzyme YjbQ [Corallococcus]|uniref:YjbQ family protein n=2 Tax=Corallococcus TaxID=83461 RepID=A0A3A8IHM7_9BACT|nr:secondary thiamine-phosphate synthase enzyme YjbQ [Corallococcus exercitus]NOK35120.1 YjbQ family protein [Corallococcus exercitus]RKG79414.1 YjbQ family protein [Corallococcus exercitus]GMU04480.1 secondary thiamine-phosphate synthase enzyme YjbQ [Corallococcus sp. NO1]
MYQAKELTVSTRGRGLVDITGEVQKAVKGTGIREGLCTLFLHHTSASLLISENADPVVQRDLEAFFSRLVKDGDPLFQHDAEGPDDMPAHVRTVLTQVSLSVPVKDGEADLGTWQGVYVWEHRTSPHRRRVTVSVLGG